MISVADAQGIVTIIAAVALAIVTVITPILTYLNGKKTDKVNAKLNDAASLQEKNTEKLEIIHQATNGGLAELQGKLDTALREIEFLKGRK